MQTETLDTMTDKTQAICHWLKRSYEVSQGWSERAVAIYLQAQGDAVHARTVMASEVRNHFMSEKPDTEVVDRWKDGHKEIESVEMTPPKVNESNAAYIDWLYVADYLLLCCGTTRDEFDHANSTRRAMHRKVYQSYVLRSLVVDAISLIEEQPEISDEDAVKKLKSKDEESPASLATLKEARRWVRQGEKPLATIEPESPKDIELYKSVYF